MPQQDVRWKQRLQNFKKAFSLLTEAVDLANTRELSKLEKQGLIQSFEYTHELAWNSIKDYFIFQGNTSITGSRDATREAFKMGLVTDGEGWMEMINSRNQASHTYNQATANAICELILATYHPLFKTLIETLENKV